MKKSVRYKTAHLIEDQFEPGSNDQVLKNKLGITSPEEMDDTEAIALKKAMEKLLVKFDEKHQFTAADICVFHKIWLDGIYAWAGKYRQVNVSKGDFPFAAAAHIPSLMTQFERDVLTRNTPCNFKNRSEVIHALAETHIELVLTHPFREGNGRVARILSTLMALQSGLPLLDFGLITVERKKEYFAAIQAGLDKNYVPMEKLFSVIIERSGVFL
ncbi:MAG: Fic family protein [Thermodesulfovibrionia bacterium]|nr:Fic family protein [Thermodesulfovibrionia bacterium]